MASVGLGYDSHRFAPGRELVLGGVKVPHSLGLAGHSDADAVIHALIDALLGAASLGDIGEHFPDTDQRLKDADSTLLLEHVVKLLASRHLMVVNCDLTIITELPKLASHKSSIQSNLARLLGVTTERVSVKAKTNEHMGWIGRGEGMAVLAVAMLDSTVA